MNMQHYWNVSYWETLKYLENNLSHCHFVLCGERLAGFAGFLLTTYLIFRWATDSLYWKFISKAKIYLNVDKKVESLMGQTESKKINLRESNHRQEIGPML
jgi:hypothetical protein